MLKIERKNDFLMFLSVIVLVSFVVFILVVYLWRVERRNYRLRLKTLVLEKMRNEIEEKSEAEIGRVKDRMCELVALLNESQKDKSELERQLEEQKDLLSQSIDKQKVEKSRREETRMSILKSASYVLSRQKLSAGMPLADTEWKQIEAEMDGILGDFKYLLYQAYNITKHEYHICLLIKMGFKNNEISILISRAPNAVSQARKRLVFKLTGKEGSASELDDFIKSMYHRHL